MDYIVYFPVGLALIAGIVWAVRLEGHLGQYTTQFASHEKQDDERHDDVKAWLQRIDAKLDALPSRLKKATYGMD